jgi:hypothetical protein
MDDDRDDKEDEDRNKDEDEDNEANDVDIEQLDDAEVAVDIDVADQDEDEDDEDSEGADHLSARKTQRHTTSGDTGAGSFLFALAAPRCVSDLLLFCLPAGSSFASRHLTPVYVARTFLVSKLSLSLLSRSHALWPRVPTELALRRRQGIERAVVVVVVVLLLGRHRLLLDCTGLCLGFCLGDQACTRDPSARRQCRGRRGRGR